MLQLIKLRYILNPGVDSFRYWGEEDDHVSVASRKITHYAKSDCVGASKGLFFGLLTLICGLICLILFFVLIDHHNTQVREGER